MEYTTSLEKLKENNKQADQFAYLLGRLLIWVKKPNTRDDSGYVYHLPFYRIFFLSQAFS